MNSALGAPALPIETAEVSKLIHSTASKVEVSTKVDTFDWPQDGRWAEAQTLHNGIVERNKPTSAADNVRDGEDLARIRQVLGRAWHRYTRSGLLPFSKAYAERLMREAEYVKRYDIDREKLKLVMPTVLEMVAPKSVPEEVKKGVAAIIDAGKGAELTPRVLADEIKKHRQPRQLPATTAKWADEAIDFLIEKLGMDEVQALQLHAMIARCGGQTFQIRLGKRFCSFATK
jgi:hypothetical protein